jgi:hypothetical protein
MSTPRGLRKNGAPALQPCDADEKLSTTEMIAVSTPTPRPALTEMTVVFTVVVSGLKYTGLRA